MILRDIIKDCLYEDIFPPKDFLEVDVHGIAYDSRRVIKGGIFVAIKGDIHDGKDFVIDAIKKGASGIVFEGESLDIPDEFTRQRGVFLIRVRDARTALACISHNFFGRPSERLNVIGVTGTNGKTTTTHLIRTILETWGRSTGLIGTISYSFGGQEYPALHTTPEAVEFQSLLKDMLNSGCDYAVTEVSSHSLKQKRVDFTRFSVAVFTNLTRDHLDFHKTMDDYYLSKRRLFTELLVENGTAVINSDDDWGKRLISDLSSLRPDIRIITYGLNPGANISRRSVWGDVSPVKMETSPEGSLLIFRVSDGYDHEREIHVCSPLIGIPNIYNILSALSVALVLNIPEEVIREALRKDTIVKGRFEKIDEGQDFLCIIDYAHTPDALERLILTAREIISEQGTIPGSQKDRGFSGVEGGRVITVFGCGGNRDRGKRPIMGRIATELSDHVIITSDNPRDEDPDAIISDVISEVVKDNYEIIPDREDAIKRAVMMAVKGDIVLIAGKGHEDYQEIKGKRERFSDRDVCVNALRERFSICRA